MTSSSTIRNGSIRSTPRARNQSQTRVTSRSGADAPEVMPTVVDAVEPALVDLRLVVDQVRRRRRRRGRRRRAGSSSTSCASRSRAAGRSRRASPSPPTGGWRSRSRCPPSSAPTICGKRRRSVADDLGRLVDRERRLRDVGEAGVRRQLERLRLGDVLDEDRRLRRLAHRADDLLVAGVADQERPCSRRPRSAAPGRAPSSRAGRSRRSRCARAPREFACTDGATPWAE